MTDQPVSPSPRETADDTFLGEIASALCMDAQANGYDHGANPTLVSFQPPYCPRHLGIAQSLRYSLSREPVTPSRDSRGALDNDLRSFVANVETAAEDNGTPAVLIADLWALARDWMRDRAALAARPDPEPAAGEEPE